MQTIFAVEEVYILSVYFSLAPHLLFGLRRLYMLTTENMMPIHVNVNSRNW